jgi:hypothetical protein
LAAARIRAVLTRSSFLRNPARSATVAVLASALLLSACSSSLTPPAALVSGQRITDQTLQDNIRLFKFLGEAQQQPCGHPDPGERGGSACARFVLFNLIEEHLFRTYGEHNGVTLDRKRLSGTLRNIRSQLGPRLGELLGHQSLHESDLRAFVKRLILLQSSRETVARNEVPVSKLRQDYRQRRLSFTEVSAAHIVVRTRAQAQRIAARATPQNFADLARKFSLDQSTKKQGGRIGTIPASQLLPSSPSFAKAVLRLKPNEISGPIRSSLHGIVVRPFSRVRDLLLGDFAQSALDRWLRRRLAASDIEVNPRYGRLDLGAEQIVPIRSTSTTTATTATPSAT